MLKAIAFANHKGGVGKTTSAVNIASCFAETGMRVLVVDLDPQGSATLHFGVQDSGEAFLHAMEKTVALPVVRVPVGRVDLVPSGPALASAVQRFSGTLGMELLGRCLARTSGDWGIAVIDCPPSLEIFTLSALLAARHVVVPMEANHLALSGLKKLMVTLESMRHRNRTLSLLGIIACRANPRRRIHKLVMTELEESFPGKTTPLVRENAALAEAPAHGQSIIQFAPNSIGAEDYRNVSRWLLERLG